MHVVQPSKKAPSKPNPGSPEVGALRCDCVLGEAGSAEKIWPSDSLVRNKTAVFIFSRKKTFRAFFFFKLLRVDGI